MACLDVTGLSGRIGCFFGRVELVVWMSGQKSEFVENWQNLFREKEHYMNLIRTMIKTHRANSLSREKLAEIQQGRLKKLVDFAKKTVPSMRNCIVMSVLIFVWKPSLQSANLN